MQRLPRGAAVYNRPCTFSDGVTQTPVRCPFAAAPVVQPAPVTQAAFVQPDDGPMIEDGPAYYYSGSRRYYRHSYAHRGHRYARAPRAFHVPRHYGHRPVAYRGPVHWKKR